MNFVTVRVPGKLMLMGEYAVTELGHPGVVAAINRYLQCQLRAGPLFSLVFGRPRGLVISGDTWDDLLNHLSAHSALQIPAESLRILDHYFRDTGVLPRPFELRVSTELHDSSGRKYGLGSSSALTAAIIASLLTWTLSRSVDKDKIFKLAALAHLAVQPRGSLADLAAAVFGGVICYQRFDAAQVIGWRTDHRLTTLVERPWPGLIATPLTARFPVPWRVGWTGQTASTPKMLDQAVQFRDVHPKIHADFLARSDAAVRAFVRALNTHSGFGIQDAVRQNRHALKEWGTRAQLAIETPAMQNALDLVESWGGAGKSSGAGGGDIIVGWINRAQQEDLGRAWDGLNIETLFVNVDVKGMTVQFGE